MRMKLVLKKEIEFRKYWSYENNDNWRCVGCKFVWGDDGLEWMELDDRFFDFLMKVEMVQSSKQQQQ